MQPRFTLNYTFTQKAAHWLIVGLCVLQIPTATAIQRTHADNSIGLNPAPFDLFLHKVHAWSGWTILLLAMVLFGLRLFRGVPRLPPAMPALQCWLAHAVHLCLYAGILALAVTGTGTMYLSRNFAPFHILLTKAGIGLVALHAAAALWHQFMLRDGLLQRMTLDFRGSQQARHGMVASMVQFRHRLAITAPR